jgi:hypothetical protein
VHIRPVQVRSGPARLFSRGGQKLSPPIGNKLSLSSEESALFNILNDGMSSTHHFIPVYTVVIS